LTNKQKLEIKDVIQCKTRMLLYCYLLSGPLRLNVMLLLLRKCKGGLQSAYLDSEISVMPNTAEVNST